MANHVKPTIDELDASIAQLSEELETEKETADAIAPETDVEEDVVDETEKDPDVYSDEEGEEAEEKIEDKVEDTKKEDLEDKKITQEETNDEIEDKADPDYKKKFTESTREAQVLYSRNKKMSDALKEASEIAPPSDDEMKNLYSEWDAMSEFEKKMAIKTEHSERRFAAINKVSEEFKNFEAWENKVNGFLDDPITLTKHQELDGLQDEFKLFASKPTRVGVDFNDLISAFLFENEKTKVKHKGQMFHDGSSRQTKRESKEVDIEKVAVLRKTNFSKYKELIKSGKI